MDTEFNNNTKALEKDLLKQCKKIKTFQIDLSISMQKSNCFQVYIIASRPVTVPINREYKHMNKLQDF